MANALMTTVAKSGGGGGAAAKMSLQEARAKALAHLDRARSVAKNTAAGAARGGTAAAHIAEAGAACFLASAAEGMFPKKMKLFGKVDWRVVAGGLMATYGVVDAVLSPKPGLSAHAMAVGNGVLLSALGSSGREVGAAWREKREKTAGAGAGAPMTAGEEEGRTREVRLTDPPAARRRGFMRA